jgi:DNA-binding GntR family transcriptional regulator
MTQSEAVYAHIKKAITSLTFHPGQRLSEARLASQLGVGRSPIRSALARLANEGWVRVLPQSGTFVSELSLQDVLELAVIRLLLEPHVARLAATRIPADELDTLRLLTDRLKKSGLKRHFPTYMALDDRIHFAIHRAAGNRRIAEILRTLHDQIHWVRVSTATLPGRVERSMWEMDQILRALERRDPDAAEAAMRRHIRNIAKSFRAIPRTNRKRARA